MNAFRTVAREASAQIEIKRSRFLAFAFPICSQEQASLKLDELKKRFHDASHLCYAYVLGGDGTQAKYTDDNEPQGTAGIPILEVVRKNGLTDVLVAVVRYYGGIQLGAGGLARAYGAACAAAVALAGVCRMVPASRLLIECPYALYDRLDRYMQGTGLLVQSREFKHTVFIMAFCPKERTEEMMREIVDQCSGQAACKDMGTEMVKWPHA